jgi:transcriptional regulator with XRE-family HTH domain
MKAKQLIRNPKLLKHIRVALGLSQIQFARLLGTKQSTLSALERGKIKTLSMKTAEKIGKRIKLEKISFFSKNEVRKQAAEIASRGKFKGEYARKMALKAHSKNAIKSAQAQKLTTQEKKIEELLKRNSFQYEIHPVIETGGVSFVADFAINKKGCKIILEAKNLKTRYRIKAQICELAYKATRIKRFHKNVKMIAVINGKLMQSEKKILSDEFDVVFNENEERKIIKFVNGLF